MSKLRVGDKQGREMGECSVSLGHLGKAVVRCVRSIGCSGEDAELKWKIEVI